MQVDPKNPIFHFVIGFVSSSIFAFFIYVFVCGYIEDFRWLADGLKAGALGGLIFGVLSFFYKQ